MQNRYTSAMKKLPLLAISLVILLSSCLPRFNAPHNVLESQEAIETRQVADIAFHRMEIGKLQSGEYNTNVLVDLVLPQGTQWTLIAFGEGTYTLRFSSQAISGFAWLVSPEGVALSQLASVEN